MSIQVKLRRGTTAQHSSFTGAIAEVTVDTDKKTLVVHDGSTPGGFPLPTSNSGVDSVNGQTGAVVLDAADVGAATSAQGALADTAVQPGDLAAVATSGSYADLTGSPDYITFDTTPETTPTAAGSLFWDKANGNQTLSIIMEGGDVTQQVGMETYFRVKASSAITNGQCVMATGTVGNSGVITAAPATGLTPETGIYVIGVATEDIANNGFGYVTNFGLVRGINTTGGAESWIDGQILYYNPAVTGGLTKTVPTAPNPKVVVAMVVNAASNGSLFVRLSWGSVLGGTDGNVEFGTLSNNDFIVYNGTSSRWENKTPTNVKTALGLAAVATSGAYADLSGTPSLATVATTGAYNDLTGKPTLGTAASKDAGSANGVAELDGSGTVPTSQLPAAVLGAVKYQGSWNASANSPTLASGAGTQGYYYVVGTAGSTNLDGITDWKVGDWAIYNGTAWQKIDNTDAVTSVAGKTGAVTLVASDVSGLATVATSGAYTDLSGRPTLGTAAAQDSTAFATAAQGTKADSALQPAAIGVSVQAYDADLTSWAAIAPSAKQDALVSGTNIKSVNSTSLLGSGNLELFNGGLVKVSVVSTLPGSPDANTLYIVTT